MNETKVDLHVHTRRSPDSILKEEDLPKLARMRGLGGVAITDHNTIWPHSACLREKACIIPGIEVRTQTCEVLGLFVSGAIASSDPFEVVDRIHSQAGIAVLPHPYSWIRRHNLSDRALQELVCRVDAVEVINARNTFSYQNAKADSLAQEFKKIGVAGSDAHTPWELGSAYTIVSEASSPDEIYDKIMRGETRCEGNLSNPAFHLMSLAAGTMRILTNI